MTKPWWFTVFGWLIVVPADFVMSRDMLHGVKERAEARGLAAEGASMSDCCDRAGYQTVFSDRFAEADAPRIANMGSVGPSSGWCRFWLSVASRCVGPRDRRRRGRLQLEGLLYRGAQSVDQSGDRPAMRPGLLRWWRTLGWLPG